MRGRYFTTFELALLAEVAVFLAATKILLRIPMHLPGKSGLFAVAFLLVARYLVPKWGSATLVSLVASLILTSIGQGEGLLMSLPRWLARGMVIDTLCMLGGARPIPALLVLAGILSSLAQSLMLFLMLALAGAPTGYVAVAMSYSVATHMVFGAVGGAIAGLVLRALESGGLFAYLAERR